MTFKKTESKKKKKKKTESREWEKGVKEGVMRVNVIKRILWVWENGTLKPLLHIVCFSFLILLL